MEADIIDQANERAQAALDAAIAAARTKTAIAPRPTHCMNGCGDLLVTPRPPAPPPLYCCPECKTDHEARQAIERRQGRR